MYSIGYGRHGGLMGQSPRSHRSVETPHVLVVYVSHGLMYWAYALDVLVHKYHQRMTPMHQLHWDHPPERSVMIHEQYHPLAVTALMMNVQSTVLGVMMVYSLYSMALCTV